MYIYHLVTIAPARARSPQFAVASMRRASSQATLRSSHSLTAAEFDHDALAAMLGPSVEGDGDDEDDVGVMYDRHANGASTSHNTRELHSRMLAQRPGSSSRPTSAVPLSGRASTNALSAGSLQQHLQQQQQQQQHLQQQQQQQHGGHNGGHATGGLVRPLSGLSAVSAASVRSVPGMSQAALEGLVATEGDGCQQHHLFLPAQAIVPTLADVALGLAVTRVARKNREHFHQENGWNKMHLVPDRRLKLIQVWRDGECVVHTGMRLDCQTLHHLSWTSFGGHILHEAYAKYLFF